MVLAVPDRDRCVEKESFGAVVEAYDTDAYGNTIVFTGPGSDGVWFTDDDVQSSYGANEIIYCGYRFDAETELYYVRNRTYNPVLGRWLQRDPIGYQGGVNLYEYVMSEPVGAVDAMGLARCIPCYLCQENFDRQRKQFWLQLVREAASMGIPDTGSALKIIVGAGATGTAAGFWGGIWGAVVGAGIGGVEGISKVIEWGAYMQQYNAEKQSIVDAYKRCMANCSNG